MADLESYDVLVVGAGIAGLVAANRAAEQDLSVLVLEKGLEEKYLCNSRYTGGFFHVGMQDINNAPDRLKEIINTVTCGHADPTLAEALAVDIRRGIDWLKANVIRFIRVGPEGYMSTVLAPPGLRQTGLHWEGRGGDVMLRTLGERLQRRGGALKRGLRAVSLRMNGGRCVGIEADEDAISRGFEAKRVVLADGGFQADAGRVKANISPRPELVLHRGAATGSGDGARMAEEVGAQLVRLDTFYGHVQHLGALNTDALWPYPVLDMIAAAGIAVDGHGRRFCDEGQGGVFIANAIAKLDDPASAKVIFDRLIWEGPGKQFLLPANPYLRNTGAVIFEAGDIVGLAANAGVPGEMLRARSSNTTPPSRRGDSGALRRGVRRASTSHSTSRPRHTTRCRWWRA